MDVQFVVFKENGERKSFPLRNQTTIVGRKEDSDIRIPLPEVSRAHAEVTISRHGVNVKDLGSANGVYVNNARVKQRDLVAGDRLVIGPVVFTVLIDGEPKDIKPVKTKVRKRSVFTAEDNLAPSLEGGGKEKAAGSSGEASSDSEAALEALQESSEGSLEFDIDELDLSSSMGELDLGDSLEDSKDSKG